jgi:hypothetical protein
MAITWRKTGILGLLLSALMATGCLLKEEEHTWYLEPEFGQVTWTVLERDVRSDASAPADRNAEEQTYWMDVQAENHQMARALRRLGGTEIRTRILRADAPYSVVTDAKFGSIEDLGRSIIALGGLSGTSVLRPDGALLTWTLTLRDPHAEEPPSDEAVIGLLGAFDSLRVVLTAGRFESAQGFTFDSDRRVARIDREFVNAKTDEVDLVLTLQWTARLK